MSFDDAKMFDKRIILGGPPRSGSTLTRYLLDRTGGILAGPETSFFLLPLCQTQARLARILPKLSAKLQLSKKTLRAAIRAGKSSFDAYDGIMTAYARAVNVTKTAWAEKTPMNCFHYHRLAAEDPEALFVSVVRHGLDVVTSKIVGHPKRGDEYWCSIQRFVDSMQAVAAFDHPQHFVLRYEMLVRKPHGELQRLFAFLDLPFEPEVVEEFHAPARSRNPAMVNQPKLAYPIQDTWVDRWKLPEHAERVREFVANDRAMYWLDRFGYAA